MTKIVGKHNLQFGAYFVAAQKNELSAPGVATNGVLSFDSDNSSVSTGNAFADLLIGNIASFSQTSAQPKFYNRYKIFEPYFQDDWRVTSHLTVNLGLRVSMFGTYRDRYHNEFNFDPAHFVAGDSSVDPITNLVVGNAFNGVVQCGVTKGVPDSCMKGHLFNPAPRIGFVAADRRCSGDRERAVARDPVLPARERDLPRAVEHGLGRRRRPSPGRCRQRRAGGESGCPTRCDGQHDGQAAHESVHVSSFGSGERSAKRVCARRFRHVRLV